MVYSKRSSAYYRKYRPQSLEELIGQEHVKLILSKASQNNQLAHAYLFCGPKGTGKTSTARILAKIVNCERTTDYRLPAKGEARPFGRQTTEKQAVDSRPKTVDIPCNKCASCISITDGSNLDFIEIDAASNRGIDDIRSLRENIKLAPSSAQKKVYVIDEVHMLTTEAFNALLKTLEEPPEHVLFILATTEAHKIPATILSRVQRLDFQLATTKQLLEALKIVVKAEKLEVEDNALELIAKRAEGSFRDCQKLLDQLASRGKKITLKDVEDSILSGSQEDVNGLLKAISGRDSKKALEVISTQVEKGVNLREFTHDLLEVLRTMMFSYHLPSEQVKKEEKLLTLPEVLGLINSLHQALEKMKTSSIASLPLEVVVVESCQIRSENTEILVNRNTDLPISSGPTDTLVISDRTKEKLEEAKIDAQIPELTATNSEDLNKLLDKWTYILETVKPYNYSLEALLRQAKVINCDEGRVILEVPYSFHQRILEAPKSRDLLESVISDVLGRESRVSCVLGVRPIRVEEIANVEIAADDDIISVAAEIFNSDSVN